MSKYDRTRKVGEECSKWYHWAIDSGFFDRYMSGPIGLDIGGVGYLSDTTSILETATIIDLETPGYDGIILPHETASVDYILSSHMLEHVPTENVTETLREWLRVLKTDSYLVVTVPHKFLYECKENLPSLWNADHKRFYTPAKLLAEIEEAFEPNSYRIELLKDSAEGFDYTIPPESHSGGCYEIMLVVKKIEKPEWELR